MADLSAVTYPLSVMLEDGETVSLQKVGSQHAEAFAREAADKGFFYEIGDAGVFIPGRRIKTVWIRAA